MIITITIIIIMDLWFEGIYSAKADVWFLKKPVAL